MLSGENLWDTSGKALGTEKNDRTLSIRAMLWARLSGFGSQIHYLLSMLIPWASLFLFVKWRNLESYNKGSMN